MISLPHLPGHPLHKTYTYNQLPPSTQYLDISFSAQESKVIIRECFGTLIINLSLIPVAPVVYTVSQMDLVLLFLSSYRC